MPCFFHADGLRGARGFFYFFEAVLSRRREVGTRAGRFFFATRPLFVEQSRVAEVFLLNALFAVSILIALQRDRFTLAAFLFGVGLGNHQTLVVIAPAFLWNAVRDKTALREWILASIAFAFGLSIYLYLPIRAHASPPVNFGDPETFLRFWGVVTRKEFGALSLHPAAVPFRSRALLLEQFAAFLHRSAVQLGAGGVVLCIIGFVVGIFRRNTRLATLLVLLIWLGVGFGFEALANLSPSSDIGQWRLERFMLLPLMAACGFVLFAFDEALSASRMLIKWISTGALAMCVASSAWASLSAPNFRWNLAFRDFAIDVLRSAPLNTRLIIDRVLFDEPTSSLLVATQVENKRPDIRFYYRPGTLFEPVYGKDILDLTWDDRFRRQSDVEGRVLASSEPVRCLAFEKKNTPFRSPVLDGVLYSDQQQQGNAAFLIWRAPTVTDYPTRLISAHVPYFIGKAELDANYLDLAIRWLAHAVAVGYDMAWLHSNIGGIFAQHNMLTPARWYFEKAARLDPYFYEGPFGVGFVALKEERFADAVAALTQAVRVAPDRSDGWYMLGVACYESHDMPAARRAWEKYLALDPNGPMAEAVGKKLQE